MTTRRVSFTFNHFLRLPRIEVDWLVQGKVANEKEHFHCKDSSHKTRRFYPKGQLGLLPLALFSFDSSHLHLILLIPLFSRKKKKKKMAHAGASINAAPLVVSSDALLCF
jgi:hypothetical protein